MPARDNFFCSTNTKFNCWMLDFELENMFKISLKWESPSSFSDKDAFAYESIFFRGKPATHQGISYKKSRIPETLNLSTDADISTDTKRDRFFWEGVGIKQFLFDGVHIFFFLSGKGHILVDYVSWKNINRYNKTTPVAKG